MHGFQHKQMGVAASIGVLSYVILAKAPVELSLCVLTTPVGAMLPDIDHDKSKLGASREKVTKTVKFFVALGLIALVVLSYISGGLKAAILNGVILLGASIVINVIESNKFVKAQLGFIVKHRGIMHTCIPVFVFMATTLWLNNKIYSYAIYGLCLGYLIHLIGDMATVMGAPILWPLTKKNIRYLKLHTSKHSMLINIVCWLWCALFIGVGIYFGKR